MGVNTWANCVLTFLHEFPVSDPSYTNNIRHVIAINTTEILRNSLGHMSPSYSQAFASGLQKKTYGGRNNKFIHVFAVKYSVIIRMWFVTLVVSHLIGGRKCPFRSRYYPFDTHSYLISKWINWNANYLIDIHTSFIEM